MAPECTLENIQPRTIKTEEEAREVGGGTTIVLSFVLLPETPRPPLL